MVVAENLTGRRFGRLVVKCRKIIEKKNCWLCECDCGNTVLIKTKTHLIRGRIKSCGCYNRDRITKHNSSYSDLYGVWHSMKNRCYNCNYRPYKNYGARGIVVCEQWKYNYQSFQDWALSHGYKKGLSLDRIDNNGNYCPDNCRWTDVKTQSQNRRTTKFLTYDGKTLCLQEWAERIGIPPGRISWRLAHGWPIGMALSGTKYRPRQISG